MKMINLCLFVFIFKFYCYLRYGLPKRNDGLIQTNVLDMYIIFIVLKIIFIYMKFKARFYIASVSSCS